MRMRAVILGSVLGKNSLHVVPRKEAHSPPRMYGFCVRPGVPGMPWPETYKLLAVHES